MLPEVTLNTGASGAAIGVAVASANGPVIPAMFCAATFTKIAEPFGIPVIVTVVDDVELLAHVKDPASGVSQVIPSVDV